MHLRRRPIFTSNLRICSPCRTCILLFLAAFSAAQTLPPVHAPEAHSLTIVVLDENGVAVPGARLRLVGPSEPLQCETDLTGHCKFPALTGSPCGLRWVKEGFSALVLPSFQFWGVFESELIH